MNLPIPDAIANLWKKEETGPKEFSKAETPANRIDAGSDTDVLAALDRGDYDISVVEERLAVLKTKRSKWLEEDREARRLNDDPRNEKLPEEELELHYRQDFLGENSSGSDIGLAMIQVPIGDEEKALENKMKRLAGIIRTFRDMERRKREVLEIAEAEEASRPKNTEERIIKLKSDRENREDRAVVGDFKEAAVSRKTDLDRYDNTIALLEGGFLSLKNKAKDFYCLVGEPLVVEIGNSTLKLENLGGRMFLNNVEITKGVVIGRGKTANIKVDDENVSRSHVTIRVEGDQVWLQDHSTNGTKVRKA